MRCTPTAKPRSRAPTSPSSARFDPRSQPTQRPPFETSTTKSERSSYAPAPPTRTGRASWSEPIRPTEEPPTTNGSDSASRRPSPSSPKNATPSTPPTSPLPQHASPRSEPRSSTDNASPRWASKTQRFQSPSSSTKSKPKPQPKKPPPRDFSASKPEGRPQKKPPRCDARAEYVSSKAPHDTAPHAPCSAATGRARQAARQRIEGVVRVMAGSAGESCALLIASILARPNRQSGRRFLSEPCDLDAQGLGPGPAWKLERLIRRSEQAFQTQWVEQLGPAARHSHAAR